MKLTLRTLLAWKDGMLPADTRAEIATKVGESPVARQLAARIEASVADPGLAAPGAGGATVDANTTAEYLDNVLEGPALEEFERGCLAAGDLLAETAACHEMLAELARQPAMEASLDTTGREMLLTAVRARAAIRGIALPPAAAKSAPAGGGLPAEPEWPVACAPDDEAGPSVVVTSPAAAATSAAPRGRGVASTAAWLLAAAAILLLAGLVGVLGWSLSRGGGRRPRDVAVREPAVVADVAVVPVDDAPAADTEPAPREVQPPAAAPPPLPAEPAPAAVVAPVPPAPAVPVPPRGEVAPPAEESAPVAPADVRVPQGDALAIVAPAPVEMPADAPAVEPPPADAPPEGAVPRGVVVGGDAAVLWRPHDDPGAAWSAAERGAEIGLPVELLAPAFCRPAVVVDGARIELEPASRAVVARGAGGEPRLVLVDGAAVVEVDRADAALGVTAAGLAGLVTAQPGAPFGVEVKRVGGGAVDGGGIETARVVAPRGGRLAWRQTEADGGPRGVLLQGVAAEASLEPLSVLEWRAAAADAAVVAPPAAPPAWLSSRGDAVDRAAARAVAAALTGNVAVKPALEALAADRRVEHRMSAAATLALLGDVEPMVELLCSDDPRWMLSEGQWTRLVAAGVVPLMAGPDADVLCRAFEERGPPGAGELLARLAAGFSDADLEAGAAAELVAALESPHLVVRRFAIAGLVEIARPSAVERLKYRADRPADMLREGAAWWRDRLDEGRIRRGAPPPEPAG